MNLFHTMLFYQHEADCISFYFLLTRFTCQAKCELQQSEEETTRAIATLFNKFSIILQSIMIFKGVSKRGNKILRLVHRSLLGSKQIYRDKGRENCATAQKRKWGLAVVVYYLPTSRLISS